MELLKLAMERLKYCDDGNLVWSNSNGRSDLIGNIAGSVSSSDGYRYIKINQKRIPAHRIVFFIHKGFIPKEIDHINRVRDDNRIENLRECKHIENSRNQSLQKREKTSRYKGVCFDKSRGLWMAYSKLNGKCIYLGRYKSEYEAATAYNNYAKENFGEFYMANSIDKTNYRKEAKNAG